MTPKRLRHHIKRLHAETPCHKALEKELQEGVGFGNAWYGSQKEHWLGWLNEYRGKGAYGRSAATSAKDAAYVWNHIQCAPMLLWLAEALGLPDEAITKAYNAAVAAGANGASRCGALRKVLPWELIETALATRKPNKWAFPFT